MWIYKKIKIFISLVCALSLLLPAFVISIVAGDVKTVTATTLTSIKQGESETCYVSIDSTESLAALDVTVHFDPAKVKVNSVYNSVSAILYDSAQNTDSVQFNYILDGLGSASQTRLFYFTYQVLSDAEVGDTYFDITIGESYDSALNDVAVYGSRTKVSISETVTNKTCSVFSSSTVSTSVEKEISLSYQFSTDQIASGSAVIQYDPELFEVASVTKGAFLDNKTSDVNTSLLGSVYVSFVGTEYNMKRDFVTVTFKTLKNVSEVSEITFKVTELFDKELNVISCSDYVTTANISFDDAYIGNAPKMSVSADFNAETEKVTVQILLEADSNLGAGDFVFSFDPSVLTLSSYEKGFAPDFFNVNDKETAVGKLKFSIISFEDITKSETVLIATFDAKLSCSEVVSNLSIDGSMLGDSETKPIALNFIDGSVILLEKHMYSGECDRICDLCSDIRETGISHSHDNACDTTCNVCGEIRAIFHDYSVQDKDETNHWMKCSVCGAINEDARKTHIYDNACDPTCNECGAERQTPDHEYDHACDTACNVCGEVRAISHTYDNACDADCNVCGEKRSVPEHVYDWEKDTDCNECGFVRYTLGDLDGEEGVSSSDVVYLLYHTLFGEERYPIDQPCDYDESGTVDSGDAIYLLYYTLFGKERYPL